MKKNFKKEKNVFILGLILAIIVLSIPPISRLINKDPLIIGALPYYNLRIAEQVSENPKIKYDPLSYTGSNYIFDPYHYFLAFFFNIFGTVLLLPFILGIASVILFYFLIKKLQLNLLTRALTMLTLIASPIFIYSFTTLNKHSLVILLMLLGFLLFLDKRTCFISIIILAILPFFSTLATIISILLILCYSLIKKEKIKQFYILLTLTSLVLISFNLFVYSKYGPPDIIEFISFNYLERLFSELGSFVGLAMFNFILMIIGIGITWRHKRKLWLIYLSILILFITLSFFEYSNIYLKFLITPFIGIGFYRLISMKWKLKFIRDLTIFILILGILFSITSYTNRLVKSLPNKNTEESLKFLDVYSDPEEIVLSHYSRGFWIEYFAKRATVMDSKFTYAPSPNERYYDINAIFYGVNLDDTKNLLNNYQIKYIYIDPEMKQGVVWEKEKQGLLFLFRNNETFKNIYNKDGIEIWKYLQD